ncbi:MAG: hypothetical protein ABW148_18135 [Sedimenticola sp.]
MARSSLALWLIAGLLFVAVAGVAIYKVQPLLNPKIVSLAALDGECDLRAGPCSSELPGGGRITFGIEPLTLPLLKPLQLQVNVEGVDAESVEVDFIGIGMEMGFNRPALSASTAGRFSGEGILPVCVRDAMEWEARVLVQSDRGLVAAPFRFIAVKPGGDLPGSPRQ